MRNKPKLEDFKDKNEINDEINKIEYELNTHNNFKKTLIEDIFTKKVRLNGFDDEWREVSLGEIGTFHSKVYKSKDIVDDGLLALTPFNIGDNIIDFYDPPLIFVDENKKEELVLKKNDFIICANKQPKGFIGKTAQYKGDYEDEVIVGPLCSIYRTDNIIVKYLLQTEEYMEKIHDISTKITTKFIEDHELEKIKFQIPSINEQESIINFLEPIEEKIKMIEEELEEALRIKNEFEKVNKDDKLTSNACFKISIDGNELIEVIKKNFIKNLDNI